MPKEKIYDAAMMFDVQVGWEVDREVQVSVLTHTGQPLGTLYTTQQSGLIASAHRAPCEAGEHCGESAHCPPASPREDPNSPDPGQWSGLYSTLDRAGINRLIRALRKARDAAYGRDE